MALRRLGVVGGRFHPGISTRFGGCAVIELVVALLGLYGVIWAVSLFGRVMGR